MKKVRYVKKPAKSRKNSIHLSKAALVVLFGAIAAILTLTISLSGAGSSSGVAASSNPALGQSVQKRYKGTRALVVDRQTGQLRMPTKEEVDEAVANLSTLTRRSSEGLQQMSTADAGVAMDLDGGFGGVMLARPNDDGTWETKCVFTFEEGAAFLGLVEDKSVQ
jgi:hypothetical protein